MLALAIRQLLKNKKRTTITIVGIVLSVAMITAVAGFVMSAREMMRQVYIRHSGDSHAMIFPVNEEQISAIAGDSRVESSYTKVSEREDNPGTAIYFRIENVGRDYETVTAQIAEDHSVSNPTFDYNQELLAVEGVIGTDQSLLTVYTIGGVLGLIILVASVIVISNAFAISATERLQQFGLLKSIGATKRQIVKTVLVEGVALSVVAIPLGILVGWGVEWIALLIANNLLSEVSAVNDGAIYFPFVISGVALMISMVSSLITVFLSAYFPARRASKVSAIEAISLTNEVKIKTSEVKVSPLIQQVFGFEGSLAAKALKRNRRKYRATVISLVVSIVLFIIGSGFGSMVQKSTDILYRDFGVNVIMYYRQAPQEITAQLTDKLAVLPGEISMSQRVKANINIGSELISSSAKKYLNSDTLYIGDEAGNNLNLIAISENDFTKILQEAKLKESDLASDSQLKGILVNLEVADGDSQRSMFAPFNYEKNLTLNFKRADKNEESIQLVGEITDALTSIAPYVHTNSMNILVSEDVFKQLTAGELIPETYWVVQTDNSAAYSEQAKNIFEEVNARLTNFSPDGKYAVVDYAQNASLTQDINSLAQIFIYGFLAMLTLIAVTSVLGTISTNINLRLPEFAMLSAIGMTSAGLHKMLNLESLFYGLKALMIGLPIALGLYYLMYRGFGLSVGFAFMWPWTSILISIGAVMLITFISMNYATKILRHKNIIELIRMMNI